MQKIAMKAMPRLSLRTRSKNISDVLNKELQAIKEKVKYMNITIGKTVKKKTVLL